MASFFGTVSAVVERPVGTTLAVAATAGDGTITVDDVSKLQWPAGGLSIGTQTFIYEVVTCPDQTIDVIDLDEDDEGSDEVGTLTLGGRTLSSDYDVDEPVVQHQGTTVTERLATVLLPDQAEELLLRVPRGLWDRLPADIRQRDGTPETVALAIEDGEWVMTDVIGEDPALDGSFINASTLPATIQSTTCTGADIATFFDETWANPTRVSTSDASYATATGSAVTSPATAATTGFKFPSTGANDATVGTIPWTDPNDATADDALHAGVLVEGAVATTEYLKLTGFGFNVPVGATITGVTVVIQRQSSSPHAHDHLIKLVKGGTASGTDHSNGVGWPDAMTGISYGAAGDMWGLALAPADVNASDFGVAISADVNSIVGVDYARIKVNYTTAPVVNRSDTHFIEASAFGFAVPDDAIITGITADVQRMASDDTGGDFATDNQVRLTNGTDTSDDRSVAGHWPTAEAFATYGGDLWGLTWTADQVNDAAFGLLVSADVAFGVTASVDFIRLTVAYVTAGDA